MGDIEKPLLPIGGDEQMVGQLRQRRRAVAGDEEDGGTLFPGGLGGQLQLLGAAGGRDDQHQVFRGEGLGKGEGLFMDGTGNAPFAEAAELHGSIQRSRQIEPGRDDLDDLRRAERRKCRAQMGKLQCVVGGPQFLLSVGEDQLQRLPQGVVGSGLLDRVGGLLLFHHIPRQRDLELAIVFKAEFVAQPGHGGLRSMAGPRQLCRGGDRCLFEIRKDAVRDPAFRIIKPDPGAKQGDDAAGRFSHSNTSCLCAVGTENLIPLV